MAAAETIRIAEERNGFSPAIQFARFVAVASVLGTLTFNLFLCFVNTRITAMSDSHVMLMEMALTGGAFVAALDRRPGLPLFLAIFVSYMLLLFALRQQTDLKAIRDVASPAIFFALGYKLRDLRLADRLALAAGVVTLTFALFEYLMLDTYLEWFNVLGYYISRGAVTLQDSFGATKGLFISGTRPEPRTILPFLGQHRVSSVFLEPVSMGNFGVILYSWGLFRSECRYRWLLMIIALSLVTMADARFGLYTCIVVTVMRPLFSMTPKQIWIIAPFLFLTIFALYGLVIGYDDTDNGIGGRFTATAIILTNLPSSVIFGAEATDVFTADSGYAYTLTKFGLFGFVGLWTTFVLLPVSHARGWTFRGMMIIYLLLIMIISNSFYSVKTGGLMWFLTGVASAASFVDRTGWLNGLLARFQARAER
ncbi:UDP-phosphate alpha N-acetylglucosaminyltransferase [Rhizobium sp. TRM95796]|uniref:UDP-phosphate alpha N-acetylglucosaminyltransferase n=1 Tax=Rhizobium sp. TRM95796 TaxID=2979862 RepID=UPI0021E967E7|nr:UDP-phosphate alpha N-acetylglucosaminyltransferase [Rhizobium sp. TRM95796]MCV3767578.1 UDP-phosphate alpha N-acetylglucosaminyltransferase [Rhizobium sp. TRM95796]